MDDPVSSDTYRYLVYILTYGDDGGDAVGLDWQEIDVVSKNLI